MKVSEIRAAREITKQAISSGTLKRMPCEVCGLKRSHAHHEDYSKPLDIKWLCALHHKAAHGFKPAVKATTAAPPKGGWKDGDEDFKYFPRKEKSVLIQAYVSERLRNVAKKFIEENDYSWNLFFSRLLEQFSDYQTKRGSK